MILCRLKEYISAENSSHVRDELHARRAETYCVLEASILSMLTRAFATILKSNG